MFRYYVIFLLISVFTLVSGQEIPWGKLSSEEISLKDVSFEKGAEAVKLQEIGFLKITDYGYELTEFGRTKILTTQGFEHAQKKWDFRTTVFNDKVEFIDAQTINIINGKIEITKLEKKDILITKNGTLQEIAIAFPNVRVGSIIEYKIKLIRPKDLYASPWRFQNTIPTLSSKLYLNLAASASYKIILNGQRLSKKYAGKSNNKEWELNNIPSDRIYNKIYNVEDYREKLTYQYTSAKKFYGTYFSENSWAGFQQVIHNDIEKSRRNVNFIEIANKIKSGPSNLETLKKSIRFLRDNFEWNRRWSLVPEDLNSNFLKTKKGNSADFNVLLNGILKQKNITSTLAINGSRDNGRIVMTYPAFQKMNSLINIVEIENGEKLLIDGATSSAENIRFLSLNYFNNTVFNVDSPGGEFLLISPPLSEIVSQQTLTMTAENSTLKIINKSRGYFNSDSFNNKALNVFSGTKISEILNEEKDEWKTSSQIIEFEKPSNGVTVIENPFSKIIRQLKVEKDRDYPVELDFPYLATVQLKVKLGKNQNIISENFNKTLNQREGNLQYSQTIENVNGEEIVTWSLLLKQIIFQTKEIEEYNQFVEQLEEAASKAVVIKNR